jgi:hypothetical protein
MKDAWAQENENNVTIWNAQLEQERAIQAELDRQVNDENEAQRARQEREAEEQRRAIELKRPKVNSFDPNLSVSSWIEPRPAEYALERIKAKKYVELDYFTERGCREAAADPNSSMSQDAFAFTQVDGTFALRPLATQKSSKNIRRDEDLSWEEMLEAKNTMLHFMDQNKWPTTHTNSLALFFVAIELHPRRLLTNGKKALLRYQSEVRREWFDAFSRDEGFNIEIIQEDLLKANAEFVNDRIREGEMEQFRRMANAAFHSAAPRSPSRRQRGRRREPSSRTRSASPTRAEHSRRRYRSRSPPFATNSPYRGQADKHPRDGGRRTRKDQAEFFQSGADPRGGVCATCLGRHEHSYSKCDGRKLWNGSPGRARKGELGTMVGPDGLPLCFDWQLPKGCRSTFHPEKHRCSGCGKTNHGAQSCPRAEKA